MNQPLHCLGGNPAPQQISNGWAAYQSLPKASQANIWDLVAQGAADPAAPDFLNRLEEYRQSHEIEAETLHAVVQSCGFILSQSTAFDLSADQLRSDLVNLSKDSEAGFDPLLSRFDGFKSRLREGMVFGSLADHGKVLTSLDWRVDRVASSSRAAQLNTDVVYLTLRYREGEQDGRVTLQVSSAGIADLKGFLSRFEG